MAVSKPTRSEEHTQLRGESQVVSYRPRCTETVQKLALSIPQIISVNTMTAAAAQWMQLHIIMPLLRQASDWGLRSPAPGLANVERANYGTAHCQLFC